MPCATIPRLANQNVTPSSAARTLRAMQPLHQPLLVFFPRNKTIRQAALRFAEAMGADVFEIRPTRHLGTCRLLVDSLRRKSHVELDASPVDVTRYHDVFVCGESLGLRCVGPVRSFLEQNRYSFLSNPSININFLLFGRKKHRCMEGMKRVCGRCRSCVLVGRRELHKFDPYTKLHATTLSPFIVSDHVELK